MASSPTITQKFTLLSHDGHEFEVAAKVSLQSQTIRNFVDDEDSYSDSVIPLPNVSGAVLVKVIEYCKKHVAADNGDDDVKYGDTIKNWDAEFVKEFDLDTLFNVIMAANYLDIKGLLDLTCQTVADMIMGKTPEEIRKAFNIMNDFTPEEEEAIHKENPWAFNRTLTRMQKDFHC